MTLPSIVDMACAYLAFGFCPVSFSSLQVDLHLNSESSQALHHHIGNAFFQAAWPKQGMYTLPTILMRQLHRQTISEGSMANGSPTEDIAAMAVHIKQQERHWRGSPRVQASSVCRAFYLPEHASDSTWWMSSSDTICFAYDMQARPAVDAECESRNRT